MSSMFTKNFHLCFSKIKCLPTTSLTLEDDEEEQEPHHLHLQHHRDDTIIKNTFDSAYDVSLFSSVATTTTTDDGESNSEDSSTAPDFSTVLASHRFFVSSPGRSNSILDSSSSSPSPQPESEPEAELVGGGIPIRRYSPDPFSDFRKSMQEMIEAREKLDGRRTKGTDDWEYLHELLFTYLSLNPKHTHKFIIGAFVDLLVSLMDSTPPMIKQ